MTTTVSHTAQDRPPTSPHGDDALLEVADLRVRFDGTDRDVWAVNGVDLTVAPGEVFAIVGESGSGKSVSMLTVMGLVDTSEASVTGSVQFDGKELLGLPRRQLNRVRGADISMVFQNPMSSLNPVHPVGRQIVEAIRLHESVSRADARQRAVQLLDRVGIANAAARANDHPHQFSGGMRQRAMIAMALACRPKLLIADEPTTALDVTVQQQIVSLVRELNAETGMAVIWISHDLGVVAELADRVAVMYGGRIMETGTAADVYRAASHPYSAGLLRSIPRLDSPTEVQLPEIEGTPRPTYRQPVGCCFRKRCPMAEADCSDGVPELMQVPGTSQATACIHTDQMGDLESLWPTAAASTARRGDPDSPTGEADSPVGEPDDDRSADDDVDDDVVVQVRDLRVYFRSRRGLFGRRSSCVRAVDGVDLDVRHGKTLGIVGESGCGKSTLGRALVGLEEPEHPAITVHGQPLDTSRGPHRRIIQMVFQDPFSSMNPGMRVGRVITEPMRIHGIGGPDTWDARAADLLEQVGLKADDAERHPHEFSGGQRQRIAIARALAAEPDVIVCDEPVSALDVSVQAQILNLLAETQAREDIGLIFIAHDLAVVRHISDEIAVVYLGEVVERAPRDQIYDTPKHPYTQALLASVPDPDPTIDRPTEPPVTGDLPDPANPPTGCRFHTRCPIAVPGLCDVDKPALREVAAHQWVSCHLVEPADDHDHNGHRHDSTTTRAHDTTRQTATNTARSHG